MSKKSPKFVSADSNALCEKSINYIMERGKKSVARRIFNDALNIIKERKGGKVDPKEIFMKAVANVTPTIEVRPKRVGGAVYQVPSEVTPKRQNALSLRWLLGAAKGGKGKPMAERLADEILLASEGQGAAMKKKEEVHRMAEANRAFAHFARY